MTSVSSSKKEILEVLLEDYKLHKEEQGYKTFMSLETLFQKLCKSCEEHYVAIKSGVDSELAIIKDLRGKLCALCKGLYDKTIYKEYEGLSGYDLLRSLNYTGLVEHYFHHGQKGKIVQKSIKSLVMEGLIKCYPKEYLKKLLQMDSVPTDNSGYLYKLSITKEGILKMKMEKVVKWCESAIQKSI